MSNHRATTGKKPLPRHGIVAFERRARLRREAGEALRRYRAAYPEEPEESFQHRLWIAGRRAAREFQAGAFVEVTMLTRTGLRTYRWDWARESTPKRRRLGRMRRIA